MEQRMQALDRLSVKEVATQLDAELRTLTVRNTPNVRRIRRKYSSKLQQAEPGFILDLAKELLEKYGHRWIAYELIQDHQEAFNSLGEVGLEALGRGINSWWTVDSYARTLSGPAWLKGQISDALIERWANSNDLWWRRAALVSTVALNLRSHGGMGDVPRTLTVCRLLVADHADMVVKAMSWALRELVVHDPGAVRQFLDEQKDILAARVLREVGNKLETGLKNPRRNKT